MEREQKLITSAFYNLGVDINKGILPRASHLPLSGLPKDFQGTIKTQPQSYDDDEEEEEIPLPIPAKAVEKENARSQAARRVLAVLSPFIFHSPPSQLPFFPALTNKLMSFPVTPNSNRNPNQV